MNAFLAVTDNDWCRQPAELPGLDDANFSPPSGGDVFGFSNLASFCSSTATPPCPSQSGSATVPACDQQKLATIVASD